MIYSKFGTKILEIKRETEGSDWMLCKTEDGREVCWLLQDIKADEGIKEIYKAIGEINT